MDKLILETTVNYLNEHDEHADLETEVIFINYGDAIITIEDNDICLSFNISCGSLEIATITKLVVEANFNYKNYSVKISEPFLDLFDEKNDYVDTLWGEDAFDYMDDIEVISSLN